jgi:Tetratricopeptide repeat
LAVRERAVGPDHPDTAASMNNLASFYQPEGRLADALPLVQRLIGKGRAQLRAALPVLADAQRQQLLPAEQALDQALNAIQRGHARES